MRKMFLTSAAAATLCLLATPALAAPSIGISGEGSSAADTAFDSFTSDGTFNFITETFNGVSIPDGQAGVAAGGSGFQTSVGTFKQITAGAGGACSSSPGNCNNLVIFDNPNTDPFGGREATGQDGDTHWLDSNDSTEMKWTPEPAPGLNEVAQVGFYITDPNDSGGNLLIELDDGTSFEDKFPTNLGNGKEYFVTIDGDGASINSVSWVMDDSSDGFGIDLFTIAVPEGGGQDVPVPGTLALLGFGFFSIGALIRRAGRPA